MVLISAGQIDDIMGKARRNQYLVAKFVDNAVVPIFPILIATISATLALPHSLHYVMNIIIAHHLSFSVNAANMEIYP